MRVHQLTCRICCWNACSWRPGSMWYVLFRLLRSFLLDTTGLPTGESLAMSATSNTQRSGKTGRHTRRRSRPRLLLLTVWKVNVQVRTWHVTSIPFDMTVFWDTVPCSLVETDHVSELLPPSLDSPDDRGSNHHWNVGKLLLDQGFSNFSDDVPPYVI